LTAMIRPSAPMRKSAGRPMWFSPEDELTAALDNAERQTLME
jgi:hypothetical protein